MAVRDTVDKLKVIRPNSPLHPMSTQLYTNTENVSAAFVQPCLLPFPTVPQLLCPGCGTDRDLFGERRRHAFVYEVSA